MPIEIQAGETDPVKRRVTFLLVAADGLTPAEGEEGGQPTAIVNGDAGTTGYIGTLVRVARNTYYAVLAAEAVATPGTRIETRYDSAGTAEQIPGDSVFVTAFDPDAGPTCPDPCESGSSSSGGDGTAIGDAIAANAAGPAEVETDAGRVKQHPLADQIAADKYLAGKAAVANKSRGLRFTKLVPDGAG